MAGQVVYVGSAEFAVDMQQLGDAIPRVDADRTAIRSDVQQIMTEFQLVRDSWVSPAGQTFADFSSTLSSATQSLLTLLDDMITRMRTTYRNYQDAESSNAKNLSGGGSGGQGGGATALAREANRPAGAAAGGSLGQAASPTALAREANVPAASPTALDREANLSTASPT